MSAAVDEEIQSKLSDVFHIRTGASIQAILAVQNSQLNSSTLSMEGTNSPEKAKIPTGKQLPRTPPSLNATATDNGCLGDKIRRDKSRAQLQVQRSDSPELPLPPPPSELSDSYLPLPVPPPAAARPVTPPVSTLLAKHHIPTGRQLPSTPQLHTAKVAPPVEPSGKYEPTVELETVAIPTQVEVDRLEMKRAEEERIKQEEKAKEVELKMAKILKSKVIEKKRLEDVEHERKKFEENKRQEEERRKLDDDKKMIEEMKRQLMEKAKLLEEKERNFKIEENRRKDEETKRQKESLQSKESIEDVQKEVQCENGREEERGASQRDNAHVKKKTLKRVREEDMEIDNGDSKKPKGVLFSESIMDEFDVTGFCTSTEEDVFKEFENVGEKSLEVMGDKREPKDIAEATDCIKELEVKLQQAKETQGELVKNVSVLENSISVKDDELAVFKGMINSLEEEMKAKDVKMGRFEKVTTNMKKEIDNLRKIKKVGKDKEGEEKVAALNIKIEELTVGKAKAESELVRMTKVCDMQQEALDRIKKEGTGVVKKIDKKCKKFESLEGCDNGNKCMFVHPAVVCEYFSKVGKCPIPECKELHVKTGLEQAVFSKVVDDSRWKEDRMDCYFWMKGSCKYRESECNKGKHSDERFGVNKRRDSSSSFLGSRPVGLGPAMANQARMIRTDTLPMNTGYRLQKDTRGFQPSNQGLGSQSAQLGQPLPVVVNLVESQQQVPYMAGQIHQKNVLIQDQRFSAGRQQMDGGGSRPNMADGQYRAMGQQNIIRGGRGQQNTSMGMAGQGNTGTGEQYSNMGTGQQNMNVGVGQNLPAGNQNVLSGQQSMMGSTQQAMNMASTQQDMNIGSTQLGMNMSGQQSMTGSTQQTMNTASTQQGMNMASTQQGVNVGSTQQCVGTGHQSMNMGTGQQNIVTGLLHQQGVVGNPGRESSFMAWDQPVNMTTLGGSLGRVEQGLQGGL